MTREEAIKHLRNDWFMSLGGQLCVDEDKKDAFLEAVGMGIKAFRPVSRERVERIRGTWEPFGGKYLTRKKCSRCGWDGQEHIKFYSWWPNCGSPMTDEAVQMVMERMEELHETI